MSKPIVSRSILGAPWWVFMIGFLAIAITMNWEEHKAHILGILPYLFLLACPLMHFFMHGSHAGHGQEHDSDGHHHSQAHENTGAKP